MTWIEFIYKLLMTYIPINTTRIQQLQDKAEDWYKGVRLTVDPEAEVQPKDLLGKAKFFVVKYGDNWAFQTALAILFIWANRAVHDFMNPSDREDDLL